MNSILMRTGSVLLAIVAIASAAGCTSTSTAAKSPAPPPEKSGSTAGYLSPASVPDSLALLPPPPAAGTAALALDEDIARQSLALRGTPRWTLAIQDAEYKFPEAPAAFTCALNAPITQKDTPHLYTLLQRTATDASASTRSAKDKYKRVRPFVLNKQPSCTPDDEAYLSTNGSYPSGHTAFGWTWALVLSEVSPERTDTLLARGRAFGESRNVCNVHWRSDVVEGRFIATGVFAQLQSSSEFRRDLEAAKAEVAAARKKGLKPTRDCDLEAAQLKFQAPSTR